MANILLSHYTEIFRQLKGSLYIVSGDPLLRGALTDIFELMGVPTAVAGKAPLDLQRNRRPPRVGFFLVDIAPPFQSQFEIINQLSIQYSKSRILLISTASRQDLEQWWARPLPAPLLQKPFSMERLLVELVHVWRAPRYQPPRISDPHTIEGGVHGKRITVNLPLFK